LAITNPPCSVVSLR